MIALTTDGARLLDGREDWRLLDALVLAIALAQGYTGTEAAGAQSYLLTLDPPRDSRDVVVWAWTDAPAASHHAPRPTAPAAAARTRVAA